MSTHTPGPWYAKREGYSTVYVEARIGGRLIQEVAACGPTDEGQEQQDANARLIAAAPELLEALKLARIGLEAMIEDGRCGETFVAAALTLDKINAAIAKAEGAQ